MGANAARRPYGQPCLWICYLINFIVWMLFNETMDDNSNPFPLTTTSNNDD